MPQYRNIRVEPTEEAKAAMYTVGGYDGSASDYTFGSGSGGDRPAGGVRLRSVRPLSAPKVHPGSPASAGLPAFHLLPHAIVDTDSITACV